MHVAVDLDDVVLDFWHGVLASFNLEFGYDLVWNGPWDDESLKKHPALLDAGYKSWWDWMRDRDWLWALFPAVPGAIGGLRTLHTRGHWVEILTSKPDWARPQVNRWLGRWRPYYDQVTVVSNKDTKRGFSPAAVIVDDKLSTCQDWAQNGRLAILFDRVHNTPPENNLAVARDWHEVLNIVSSFEREVA